MNDISTFRNENRKTKFIISSLYSLHKMLRKDIIMVAYKTKQTLKNY